MIKNSAVAYLGTALLFLSSCASESEPSLASYPDQQSAAFQQFSRQCSSCHGLPMPDAHIATAWPMVVARMQRHKEQRGLLVMSDVEQQKILGYLQAHAKPMLKRERLE